MYISRETKILDGISVCLILLSGFLHLLGPAVTAYVSVNGFIFACYTVALMIWIYQIRRRLIHIYTRRYLIIAAALMIFWMAIRTVKYTFLPAQHIAARYMWYLYYLPYIFIPLFMVFALLCVGKNRDEDISRKWKLMYIPAVVLVIAVMTNDLHFHAFRFPGGLAMWSDSDMIRGFWYYAVTAWIAVLFAAAVILSFIHCSVPEIRKRIWIPVIPFAVGILYVTMYILYPDFFLVRMFKAPEMACFLFAAFMESLILVRLFPSNDSYGDFWNASSIGAGIMDEAGHPWFSSEQCVQVSEEQVREAEGGEIILGDGNTALSSKKIKGGYCYWIRDISEISSLNSRLSDLGDVIADENAMIDAENKMTEKRIRTEQQNSLYDSIARSVRPQLDKLGGILDGLSEDVSGEDFISAMKYGCVLNAYVKRYSNLIILSDRKDVMPFGELFMAIEESLEYVRLCGVPAYLTSSCENDLPSENALLIYRLFEEVIETALPGADAVLVDITAKQDADSLRVELSAPGKIMDEAFMKEDIERGRGTLDVEYLEDEMTEIIRLDFARGGDR